MTEEIVIRILGKELGELFIKMVDKKKVVIREDLNTTAYYYLSYSEIIEKRNCFRLIEHKRIGRFLVS